MDIRNYDIEYVFHVQAASVDEALELAREAAITEYMEVYVNGERME